MSEAPAEDVVVFIVDIDEKKISGWGRGTQAEAEEFCRDPKFPAKRSDHFIGVDNWGWNDGKVVAATPSLSNWIGKSGQEFLAAGFTRA